MNVNFKKTKEMLINTSHCNLLKALYHHSGNVYHLNLFADDALDKKRASSELVTSAVSGEWNRDISDEKTLFTSRRQVAAFQRSALSD